jgi:hypothetical protein
MLQETLSRIRRKLMAHVEARQTTVLLSRQDAWIVAMALGHLERQQGLVDDMTAFVDASNRRRSKVSGLPAVVEVVPKRLVLPSWVVPDTLEE